MWYKIDREGKEPAYLQLYKRLRGDIVDGVYPYHTRLPSKRTVKDECGVSLVTVEHAYALLLDEGYIEARERSGYFVIFRKGDGFAAATDRGFHKRQPTPHTEETPDFPFSVLAKRMRGVLTDYGEAILLRSSEKGSMELRSAIKRYLLRSRGIETDAEAIVVGSGSEYLYRLIVELLGRDKIYGIETPSYQKIEAVYLASGVTVRHLPLGADGIESEALRATDADVLHITPYRSFPSGVTATASKRHEYLRFASEAGRYLIEDDFESEFSVSRKPEDTLFSQNAESVIYMNSFSKTVSPALRVGYMVLPSALCRAFEARLGFYSCTVPTFEQLLLATLLDSGDFERHINRVRRKKRKEK